MNRLLAIICLGIMLASCGGRDVPVIEMEQRGDIKENMINANRYMSKAEETQIEEFVERHKWDVKTLDNGVRVWEYFKGDGEKVGYEKQIKIRYSLSAISSAEIYTDVEKEIVVGKNEIVPGLDAALLQLAQGCRAKVIVPSHLGYGVAGDGDKVPQNAILIFDVEIM